MSGPFCVLGFGVPLGDYEIALRFGSLASLRFRVAFGDYTTRPCDSGSRRVAPANQCLPKKGLLRGGSLQLILKLKAFQAHVLEENDLPCLADEVPLPPVWIDWGSGWRF